MKNLTISIIQTPLQWENPEANLNMFDEKFKAHPEMGELVVLPEMFTTGFTMNPERFAESCHDGMGLNWMVKKAKSLNKVLVGSIAVTEENQYFNRLYVCYPDGKIWHYDKRHLFRMAQEDKHYASGSERIIFKVNDWKICPLICYDLRFPVWSRNQWNSKGESEYDILIYVANWPTARVEAWSTLLKARAIENQCFVVGVNRIGKDGNGIEHNGESALINPRGERVSTIWPGEERIESIKLHASYLEEYRKTFPVGKDADSYSVNV
jgi:predicted amidohydrolase